MNKGRAVLLLFLAISALAADPKDSALIESKFTLPPGFRIQLIASEPDVINPMSIAVDREGALWLTEAHTYRWGTNGSPVRPPTNPIRRLELGADGRCARSKVALQGFPEPVIGIAARKNQIFATCLNELFVCDISPDGTLANRKVLVRDAAAPWNPFGMYRVQVGPDDKLWLCIADHPSTQPVTLTGSDGRQLRFAGQSGGMVRCNLDGSGLELIVHGFRAPYVFDIDPWGHLWHISNGEGSPNLYVHVIPGLDYGYASRKASYTWLAGGEPLSPPVRDMGAGANTGALHYYSSQFPPEYWGSVFIANWGSHGQNSANREIVRFRPSEVGASGTDLVEAGKFLTTTDPEFRPTGVVLAPDGGLYVIDWHGRDDENDLTGRIFKISYARGAASSGVQDAQEELLAEGNSALPILEKVIKSGDAFAAAQAIWTLVRMQSRPALDLVTAATKHPDARVRAHALRQLRQAAGQPLAKHTLAVLSPGGSPSAPLCAPREIADLAKSLWRDPNPEVRIEAALAQSSSSEAAKGLVSALALQPNRRLIHQIGFQLSRLADLSLIRSLIASSDEIQRSAGLIAIDNARHERTPLFQILQESAPDLLEEAPPSAPVEKLAWLHHHHPDQLDNEWARIERGDIKLPAPAERIAAIQELTFAALKHPPVQFLLTQLRENNPLAQQQALRVIRTAFPSSPQFGPTVLSLARKSASDFVRSEAVWTLAQLDSGTVADWMELCQDRVTQMAALRALRERGKNPPLADALTTVASVGPRAEMGLTLQSLGAPDDVCIPLLAPKREGELSLQDLSAGTALQGELSFYSARLSCSKCHGTHPNQKSFGPNLSNIGAAAQPEYLLESILHPSKIIKTGFESEEIETTDDRILTGFVERIGKAFRIKISADQAVALEDSQIKTRRVSHVSLMPEGLHASCTARELADLLAYLRSLRDPGSK